MSSRFNWALGVLVCVVGAPQVVGLAHEGGESRVLHAKQDSRPIELVVYGPSEETDSARIISLVRAGRETVEAYFSAQFPAPLVVHVLGSRSELDRHWSEAWEIPNFQSECWMVASGERHLDLLAPAVWESQACEHDPADQRELETLLTHELVHIYHTQVHPAFDAVAMDPIGWFVEGVATYASGQWDAERQARLQHAAASGALPARLVNGWSGPYRYAVAGGLVQFIESTYGREILKNLLLLTSQEEILTELGVTEMGLLGAWQKAIDASQ